jgi:hypothetical protein
MQQTQVDNDGASAYLASASWIARHIFAFRDTE